MSARPFWISQLVAATILAAGMWLVNGSELGAYPVLATSFGVGITLFHKLEDREKRRTRDRARAPGA